LIAIIAAGILAVVGAVAVLKPSIIGIAPPSQAETTTTLPEHVTTTTQPSETTTTLVWNETTTTTTQPGAFSPSTTLS